MASNADKSLEPVSDLAPNHPLSLHNNQDEPIITFIGTRLLINGFLYSKSHIDAEGKIYWQCRRHLIDDCQVKVITSYPIGKQLILFTALEELIHNHSSDTCEVEANEAAIELKEREKREIQSSLNQAYRNPESNLGETLRETEPLPYVATTGEIDEVEMDKFVPEKKFEQPVRPKRGRKIYNIALEYEAPVPPRILGEKLYIAGYLYIRRYSYSSESSDPRTRWECDQRRCQASAITSNPDMLHGAKLTVYKGPKESPHVHLPSPINAEESEEIPKYDQRSSRFELDSEKIHGQKSSNTLRRMISAPAKTNDVQVDQMCVKVIGKHLCIDGYIYSRRARGPATSWICKMHWTSGCNVTVSTSDPSLQEELTVYGMDELKNHNHPRNELDVEEAELRAKLDLNKLKRKNFLTNQRLQESKNSGSQNLPQYSLRLCPQTTSAVVTHSKSSFQPQYDVKEGSAVIQKPRRKKNRNRLHDDWAYREFLTEFSKNPKFDQENILRALKMLHSSREGCREDYENVLKNRAKIQRDINALKNNRLKVITAPTLRNVYEKTNTNLRLGTPKESSTTQKHLIRCREKDAAVTSPGSATLLVEKNLLAPLHALSDNDPKTEKELTLIDLTYDSDELEVSKQNPTIVEDMNILSKKTNESIDYREKSFPSGNNVEPDIKPDIYKFSTGFYNNFSFDLRNKIALVPFEVLSDLFNQGSNYQLDSGARNHIYNAPCFGNGLQTPPNVDVPNMRYKGIIPSVVREDMCKNSTPPSTRMVSPMHSSKYV